MGGLSALLLAHSLPGVFGMVGCLSPAFAYAPHLAREIAAGEWPSAPTRLYLDNGSDKLDTDLQPAIDDLLAALEASGFAERATLEWFRDEGAAHHESAWSQRVWRPLEMFFAPSG